MKKVFAYIGSRNEESNTLIQTMNIIKTLQDRYPSKFTYDIYSANNLQINPSTGCKNCFNQGICPIDQSNQDDSAFLKKKLLEADFIIFSSPVYSHNVSSDMKAVIERLSYWGHLFRLAGKSCVVLAAADSNGVTFVSDYMEKVFGIMGLNIVDKINITTRTPLRKNYLENLADNIHDITYCFTDIEVDDRVEVSFQTYKKMYANLPASLAEPQYWHENGLFKFETLQDYIDHIKKDCNS